MRWPLLILCPHAIVVACTDGRRFSPEAWRQEDQFQRDVFTADLIGRRLLIGKQWHEVNRMLGPGRTFGREPRDVERGARMRKRARRSSCRSISGTGSPRARAVHRE